MGTDRIEGPKKIADMQLYSHTDPYTFEERYMLLYHTNEFNP